MTTTHIPVYPSIFQAIILVVLLVILTVVIGVGLGFALVTAGVEGEGSLGGPELMGLAGLANVLSFAVVLAWAVKRTKLPLSLALPFPAVRPMVYLPLIVMLVGLGIVLSEGDNLVRSFLPIPRFFADLFKDLTSGSMASILTVVLIAPVTEELIFRGIILKGFLNRYRPMTAILVSSLLFALMHLNPYQFLGAFVMGMTLAWIFLRTGSLWPCIIGHTIFNSHGMLTKLLPFNIPGYNPQVLDMQIVEFQPLWFTMIGLVAIAAGIFGLAKTFGPGSEGVEASPGISHDR